MEDPFIFREMKGSCVPNISGPDFGLVQRQKKTGIYKILHVPPEFYPYLPVEKLKKREVSLSNQRVLKH